MMHASKDKGKGSAYRGLELSKEFASKTVEFTGLLVPELLQDEWKLDNDIT